MKNDSELQRAIHDELLFEPSVTATNIGITVKGGVATLIGTVANYAEKIAAERAAERVSGVRALAKDLVVKLLGTNQRTDEEIATAALAELQWDVEVPDRNLRVEVEKGFVTLLGEVTWNYQREAAGRDVHKLMGVLGVTNKITIKPSVSSGQVKHEIESALQRAAVKDARRITIETSGGKVTLRGEVQSWAERTEAERAAWNVPGVTYVEDNLLIA